MNKMVRQKQRIRHNPARGKFGDCYRTCVAMVMGLDPEDVPHFCDGNPEDVSGLSSLRDWLQPQGFGVFQNIYTADTSFDQLMHSLSALSPGVPVIVTGLGAREVNHCVVAIDGEVFCDPSSGKASKEPFLGPAVSDGEEWWWIEVICRLPGRLEVSP
ncbi:hypothetical protein [Roseobacter sp.]|uniref:hypothetical protein n=1 Tax=Roseobacter sp. TaxID=1907202 RepID=UPI0029674EEC|nr:hypothetical protein [Roseobacter sp.]MDW3181758.1 hypothetical protein [Roseobacter sp.]